MAGNRRDWHYAKNVHEQVNPNATKRNPWTGLEKAVSLDGVQVPVGSGSAAFTDTPVITQKSVKKTKSNPLGIKWVTEHNYNYPYVVAVYNFGLNVPSNAYIYRITFTVCMKVAKGVNAKAPHGMANIYGSAYYARRNTGKEVGWINGYYHMQPNVKLSTSWKEVEYTLNESVIKEGGITPELLNQAITGIDLKFTGCGNTEGNVYIKWAGISVEYDVPDHKVFFNIPTSPDNPYYMQTENTHRIGAIHTNATNADDRDQSYHVAVPSFGYDISNNRGVTDTWTVKGEAHAQNELWFNIKAYILGLNSISVGGATFWFYSTYGKGDDYYDVRITPTSLRKGANGCIQVNARVWDEDGIVSFNVVFNEGYPNPVLNFDFNNQLSSANVSVRSIGDSSISFSVPPRTECEVCFDVCGVPFYSGNQVFKLIDDDGDVYSKTYTVLPPYEYKFCKEYDADDNTFDLKVLPAESTFTLNRFITTTELGMYELDSLFNEETMYITDCDLTLNKFDELDYVGCVPLTHTHFDPKSDYSDTLLNETYKNKTYMGKKGVIDETITLNLRLPPRDVSTLQGLVGMDKPVPINTCHTAFEGDVLNHRGWVELYGVKDVQKTNPNYYKVSLDVKYLTHNIAYKFDILRHSKILDDVQIPSLFDETLSFDEPLSNGLRVEIDGELVESSDFFDVDTDGTYQFISHTITDIDDEEDVPETGVYDIYNSGFSNFFSLGEAQHVRLTSHKILSQCVRISCNWMSNKQGGDVQNNSVKRVFRLRDATNKNNVLFEYTYYDFNFEEDDFVKARVNSTYTSVEGDVRTLFSSEIAVMSDIDYDDDVELGVWYGSSFIFELNGNHLTITDTGYNGRELYGSCDLKTGSYIFECEFTNNLNQSYVDDALLYLDMEVLDTYLQTEYAEQYANLVVSPFPVMNKDVVFTRRSEEGVIYYMRDDDQPFKYLLEPYYQYHCGVDLKSREGISLFNLNNSYSIFYMQNGLVRIGFNRVDGEVYLSKYDPTSEEYITTHYFKLNSDVKFETGILNDDKIEILADTMIFTMWRGHPYIMVNHPNNDIQIKSIFTKVFGETSVSGMPSLINLMNEDNLLPECVGGADISSSCITTTANYENIVTEHSVTCTIVSVTPPESEPITPATLDDIVFGSTVEFGYTFDGGSEPSVASQVQYLVNGVSNLGNTYKFDNAGIYDIYAVFVGDDLNHYAVSSVLRVEIVAPTEFPAQETPSGQDPSPYDKNAQTNTPNITGKFTVTCDTPNNKHFKYHDKQQIKFTLRRGGTPISGKVVQLADPTGHIWSKWTNANGQISTTNDWDIKPKKEAYYVMATFEDQINEDDDPQVVYQCKRTIFLDKRDTKIQLNPVDKVTFNKGESVNFKLTLTNASETPLTGKPIIVSVNGSYPKTYHTNDKGQISVKLTQKGTLKFKVYYAGSDYNKKFELNKNVKVN